MVIRALVLRPLLRRPLRFLTTVVGVAAGVAAVVATVSASRAAVASLREGVVEVAGRARLEVSRPGGVDESLLGALRPLARDAVILPVLEEVALLPATEEPVRVLGLDLLVDRAARDLDLGWRDAQVTVERLLTGRGVLVPERLARRLGVAAGDPLTLSVRAVPTDVEVAATFAPPRLATAFDQLVVTDVATAQELFGRQGTLDLVQLVPREGVGLSSLREELRRLLPAGYEVSTPDERSEAAGRMVRALEFNLTALSGISLLVGAVLVATTLATSVVQRRELIALVRSLGGGKGHIRRALLAEAAALGLLGGGLGVVLGLVGARAALASVRATVTAAVQDGIPPSPIQLEPTIAVVGVLLGLVVSLAAALLPLAEAERTPPVQGLKEERPTRLSSTARGRAVAAGLLCVAAAWGLTLLPPVDDLPLAALGAALALLAALLVTSGLAVDTVARVEALPAMWRLGLPLRLAGAALGAGRRRAAWAAGAVGVTVALAVALAAMVHSFRTTVVEWAEQGMRSDLWVRPAAGRTGFQVGRLHPEVVEIAKGLFGFDAVDPFHTSEGLLEGRPVTLAGGAMAVVAKRGGVPFRDGRDSREVFRETAETRGVVVNEPIANRLGLEEGDRVRIQTPSGEVERRVTGVFRDYSRSRGMAVLDLPDFLSLYPDQGPRELALFLPEDADVEQARERLLEALGGRFLVEILPNRELRREVLALFDRTFAITGALQLVAAAVAVVAVLTVLFALLGERQRDLAVVRALGGSRRQVGRVILAQAGLLGFTGAVGGVATGLVVGLVLVKVVNLQSFGWTLRFLPPWDVIAWTGVGVVAACLLAGLAPAVSAMRLRPREALHEDG